MERVMELLVFFAAAFALSVSIMGGLKIIIKMKKKTLERAKLGIPLYALLLIISTGMFVLSQDLVTTFILANGSVETFKAAIAVLICALALAAGIMGLVTSITRHANKSVETAKFGIPIYLMLTIFACAAYFLAFNYVIDLTI